VLSQAINQTKSIGVPDLGIANIKSFVIAIPPISEQRRILEIERCMSVLSEVEITVEALLARSKRLRQAILKRAFEGKLMVTQNLEVEERIDKAEMESLFKQARLF
jgi:type I restriction enzyme, S subunit